MNSTRPHTLARASSFMMIAAGFAVLAALGLSAYFFTGFIGDGRTPLGIFQAFLLCFGTGAFIYLPSLCVFFMARHVRSFGSKTRIGIASILISLPLWGFGAVGLIIQHAFWLYALPVMALGLAILFWGAAVLRTRIQRDNL